MTRAIAIVATLVSAGTILEAQAPSRDAVLKAARQVIGAARYATLTTIDDLNGFPQSRVVAAGDEIEAENVGPGPLEPCFTAHALQRAV